jgi:broad specificity phosphatase PhoE
MTDKNPGPRLVLVRHGQTPWSTEGRHTGRSDIELTDQGREQARALKPALAHWKFDRVLVSPLKRARETCELAGQGDAAELCADLMEWDYGDYEGLTAAEIQQQVPGWTIWTGPLPGGETVEQVAERADRVIASIDDLEGDVLLVAHGHLLRVLAMRWVKLDPYFAGAFMLDPASVSILGNDRGMIRSVIRWNQTAHLPEHPRR